MGRPSFELNFQRDQVYEVGASLLALLACPDDKSERPGELQASLCARALRLKYSDDSDDLTPITVKPMYVFRPKERVDRDVGFVVKQLEKRMVASRMVMPFLQREETGVPPKLPASIKRLSINQMAEFVMEDAEQSDANNVKRRYWIPSRPVIHLAAAMAIIAQEQIKMGHRLSMELLMFDQALVADIIGRANAIEALIAKSKKFPVTADILIQVRLI